MNTVLNFFQKIINYQRTRHKDSFLEEMSIWEKKLENLPYTKNLLESIRVSLEKVLEEDKIDEICEILNITKKSILSQTCIIKRFLNQIDQMFELQKNIDTSFYQAEEILWQSLKDLDNTVSQLLKEKSIYEHEKWKSEVKNDFYIYKKMKLDELEKKKLDYDIQLRKFTQEMILFKNMKSTSSYSEKKEKIYKNFEEELKNIEFPLVLDELESFFEESDITDIGL
ncbi:hypothetical protein PCK1_002712 [Pneumocystis canis]|nr:hypothetical protein PCK1_002712 [Pneumocystis canis]